ncbi:MAG: cbb3-type cytochrome oxidase assembly protein CcoS [Colwellia sp.]|nr:cbb3-type cytochrome oxidase assembly protein CcoS [Colwellia sp.]
MSIIYILIPIAVLLTTLGIYLFFWAVKTEQFDDLEKQGMSILFDDDKHNESLVTSDEDKSKNNDLSASNNNEHNELTK